MKITLTYGSAFEIRITTIVGDVFTNEFGSGTLQEAVDYVKGFFDDLTAIREEDIRQILIIDSHTGEILAECYHDPECGPTEVNFENENYDPDWGYNEDVGFDPYLGCYTWDE